MDRIRWPGWALSVGLLCGTSSLAWAQEPAEDELKTLQAPAGTKLQLFASEPMIINPSAIDIDTKGRVWVAEIQWYRGKAKNPAADSIKVLEDTDNDGKADKVTTFAEGVFCPMSICVAGTKVYVATSPDLWVYEDKDGDLKADGPPTKLLTGFGGKNHDHGAHSLVLGPDHKWWMAHGDTGLKVSGTDGSQIESKWGAMIRGELDGTKLEAIAKNFRNPYEIAVNSFGESFCSDNDNDGNRSVRICWIMDGGDYGWFGGPPFGLKDVAEKLPPGTPFAEHWHFRGFQPGYVPGTLVTGFGSPCGMCYYEGNAFGTKYKGVPWHADAGPREVRIYPHRVAGYGMQASSENVVTTNGDNYFRPDDVCAAPDGSLFIADWYDGGVGGHAYNDPTRGRIFRLVPENKELVRVGQPGPYTTSEDALAALANPNLATQFLAREKLLADGAASIAVLKPLLTSGDANLRARVLWLLDRIGGEGRATVVAALTDKDDAFRALAVRILRRHGAEYADKLLPLADDASTEVRREVLLAVAKLDTPAALATLVKLAKTYDGKDRYQLEALNIAAANRKDALFAALETEQAWTVDKLALLQLVRPQAAAEFLLKQLANDKLDAAGTAQVIAAVGNLPDVAAAQGLLKIALRAGAAPELRLAALNKVAANLPDSWKGLAKEANFAGDVQKLLADPITQIATLGLIGKSKLPQFSPAVVQLAESQTADANLRKQAISLLVSLEGNNSLPVLRKLLTDSNSGVQQAALEGLVDAQDLETLRGVLSDAAKPSAVQAAVTQRLMGTTGGAFVVLRLADQKVLVPGVQTQAVKLAMVHPDSNVRTLFEKYVPEADRPKKLGSEFKPEQILAMKGSAGRGEKIFHQSTAAQCKNCHAVQGAGSTLGPDLSLIGRKFGPEAMLESILLPSKAISHEYVPYVVETEAGQVYVGFLVEKTDDQITLKDIKNQLIRIPAKDVAELVKQEKSLMPELVLKDVTAQDAADLLAYLCELKEGIQVVSQFRVLGPFASHESGGLDAAYAPEDRLADPDLKAVYKGVGEKDVKWEVSGTQPITGGVGIVTNRYDAARKMRAEQVVHYFLVTAQSPTEQEATLLIGSDDGVRAWVNGKQVHHKQASRALVFGEDKVRVNLKSGRNVLLLKVENGSADGGVSLGLSCPTPVQLGTE